LASLPFTHLPAPPEETPRRAPHHGIAARRHRFNHDAPQIRATCGGHVLWSVPAQRMAKPTSPPDATTSVSIHRTTLSERIVLFEKSPTQGKLQI